MDRDIESVLCWRRFYFRKTMARIFTCSLTILVSVSAYGSAIERAVYAFLLHDLCRKGLYNYGTPAPRSAWCSRCGHSRHGVVVGSRTICYYYSNEDHPHYIFA